MKGGGWPANQSVAVSAMPRGDETAVAAAAAAAAAAECQTATSHSTQPATDPNQVCITALMYNSSTSLARKWGRKERAGQLQSK